MNSQELIKFQNEMDELFNRKTTIIEEVTRIGALDAYTVQITVVGLPYTIKAFAKTLDEAEEDALSEELNLRAKALKDDLFPTKDLKEYEQVDLTRDEIKMIFDQFNEFPEELIDEYVEKTTAWKTELDDGMIEFIIENESCNVHARATLESEIFARHYAIYTARNIFKPEYHEVKKLKSWKDSNN